ncbi:target of Myb1 membrane trafficking protein-like isoform X2 [Cololabis saira]|uniref:target of Myb1 membrane trafficking protein-like isoform X2 n=1 Tax=Cololabis saira TaxID=129043 RepID=UPI002AD4EB98|nr:target of Myb1 membrane trafficking protein-like isoform X2 [Cololabis saira]
MFSISEKMEFLIGNPFSTPVGQRIERATSSSLQAEDWGLNMEICDIVNETDEGPRDAVKAIKKRIVGNKNFREIMLALTVLEACVKNCGHRFHVLVATQDFVEGVLVRSILPKYNPPTVLHDRVLSLIQSWADAFRSSPSLAGVVYVYDDLRRRGLEFPMTDLDALSPIHTPNRSIPENGTADTAPVADPTHQPAAPASPPSPPSQDPSPAVQPSDGPVSLTPEQEEKLRSELALVKGNLSVMSDMLNDLIPGQSSADDTHLLKQLFSVCKSMQARVVELIPQLQDEGFIQELLMVNDDLNNAFIRWERFDRLDKAQVSNSQQSSAVSPSLLHLRPEPSTDQEPAVLSTSTQQSVSIQSNHQSAPHKDEEEFDMFAQTRGSSLAEQRKSVRYEDPGAVEGLAGALDSRLQVTGAMQPTKNGLQNDIDKWLPFNMEEQSLVCEGVSSEEFDQFLEDRAKAADPSGQTISSVPSSTPRPPQTRNQDLSHDQLFSL